MTPGNDTKAERHTLLMRPVTAQEIYTSSLKWVHTHKLERHSKPTLFFSFSRNTTISIEKERRE